MVSRKLKGAKEEMGRYEFGGPFNVFFMIFGLPATIYALCIFCARDGCSVTAFPSLPPLGEFINWNAMMVYVLWFVYHSVIYLSPLGYTAKGMKLKDGSRLEYRMNGMHAFLLTHILFAVALYFDTPVSFVYDNYLALATSSILFSLILSIYLYVKSFSDGALLADGGNTGNTVYDFFIGRELNPRIGEMFDLKLFCEMRPGLIGWVFINYCLLVKEYELHGSVSVSMMLVCSFQFWYILDALWYEEAILTTMDIVHDGFGYMLVFGDLAWVPFTYSLQARYLVDHTVSLPTWAVVVIVAIKLMGYMTFRGANGQKDLFRRDPDHPDVKHLQTLQTERGTKLIISGWWGICRHPNYVGDLMMALSWSLPCGFNNILPYFYVTYFTILLIHRQLRDEKHCKAKYGPDWDKYCKIVKWRLIPYIY